MGTPQTMLIDVGGVVLGTWSGAYSGEVVKDVELKLGITLPGLVDLN
jgi:hypothetical protein